MLSFLATDHWYDLRDLANLYRVVLEGLDHIFPTGLVYVLTALLGFIAFFVVFVLPSQLYVGVYGERRLLGRMQARQGPNRVGPLGLLQPVADAIKLLQKEALTPRSADRLIMWAAPVLFVAPAILIFAVIPFGPRMVFADIPVSLMYFLAISSLPVIASFMAGWSSNNKYSLFGAMRIVAMSISYEIPLVLGLLAVSVLSGTMSLQGMVYWQQDIPTWMILIQPIAFAVYFIGVSAELNRTPTDIAEAESEIVAGYLTEYSGMRWGLFYGMDIAYALGASAFAATIFFGGWSLFGLEQWVPPWLIFILKTYLFYFVFIWTRGTLPRLRIDQLMSFAWKFLLPIALINLLVVAVERLIWTSNDLPDAIVWAFGAVNIVLMVGIVFIWAKVFKYDPKKRPTKPRLVNEPGGYRPVDLEQGGPSL